jgi:hypothetical protein
VTPDVAFSLASAMHAGFQLTVTGVVYPALATRTEAEWPHAHDKHRRSIAPVVLVVYGALLGTGAWLVTSGPSTLGRLALGATALAFATTAFGAAPTHGRLTTPEPGLVSRLLVIDRWRCAAALAGAACAVAAVS